MEITLNPRVGETTKSYATFIISCIQESGVLVVVAALLLRQVSGIKGLDP